jgi:ribosomal protein S18 acetylase RimI-like enzyme
VDVLILKEVLDKNTYLQIKRTFRAGAGADLGVKAFLTKNDSEVGDADVGVDGKGNAKLLGIYVKPPFRHRGIGSRMLKLLIDFLQDGMASEIDGDITASDDLPKTIGFYKKQGFSISEYTINDSKHTLIDLKLTKPKFSQFGNLHEVTRVIPKNKRLGL